MTNEELAVKIQHGERELIPELWEQVEKFVRYMAKRLIHKLPASAGVEVDDLYNAGYIGFAKALSTFDQMRESTFVNYLSMYLRTAFADTAGYRTIKQQQDPLRQPTTRSIDAPASNDGENDTPMHETIPDTRDTYECAEDGIYQEQLHEALEEVLSSLKDEQADTLRQRFYDNKTLKQIAEDHCCSPQYVRQNETEALRRIRSTKCRKRLEAFRLETMTPYFLHVGVKRFQNTGSSAVEEVAIIREGYRQVPIDRRMER